MTPLSIIMPGITFFKRGENFSGIFAIVLQLSVIGWLPAIVWAITSHKNSDYKRNVNQYHY